MLFRHDYDKESQDDRDRSKSLYSDSREEGASAEKSEWIVEGLPPLPNQHDSSRWREQRVKRYLERSSQLFPGRIMNLRPTMVCVPSIPTDVSTLKTLVDLLNENFVLNPIALPLNLLKYFPRKWMYLCSTSTLRVRTRMSDEPGYGP